MAAEVVFDYVPMWRAMQVYHRSCDRGMSLRGYMRIKLDDMQPPRAHRHLKRFIERERQALDKD